MSINYRTIALDPGSIKIGMSDMAIIDNKVSVINTFQEKLKGSTKEKRLWHLFNFFNEYLSNLPRPEIPLRDVATEATFVVSNEKRNKKISIASPLALSMARGVIYTVAGKYDLEVVEYDHSTHKKKLTGDGSAKKTQIIRAVKIKLGRDVEEDEAMSISLGYCRLLHVFEAQLNNQNIGI